LNYNDWTFKANERVYGFQGWGGDAIDGLSVRYFAFESCIWVPF
jgi:hypothetical protein